VNCRWKRGPNFFFLSTEMPIKSIISQRGVP
jgi:hypothetical protein